MAAEVLSLGTGDNGIVVDTHHPAISADGRFVAYLEEAAEALSSTCRVHFYDRDSGAYRRLGCSAVLAENPGAAQGRFGANGAYLEWYLSGQAEALVLRNPLAD
jgi:hypothetical protein